MKKIILISGFLVFHISIYAQNNLDLVGFVYYQSPGVSGNIYIPDVNINIEQTDMMFNFLDECSTTMPIDDLYECTLDQDVLSFLNVTCEKNECWNAGLSGLDLVALQRHIVFIEPLGDFIAQIAGDANNSGSLTAVDVLYIKKIILGVWSELPTVESWRFLPAWYFYANEFGVGNVPGFLVHMQKVSEEPYVYTAFNFDAPLPIWEYPNYLDPFTLTYNPANIQTVQTLPYLLAFYGIKVGDVNRDLEQSDICTNGSAPKSSPQKKLALPQKELTIPKNLEFVQEGDELSIPIKASQLGEIDAYQFGLWLSPEDFELLDILGGDLPSFSKENFGLTKINKGEIRTVWYDEKGMTATITDEKVLFYLKVRAKRDISNIAKTIKIDDRILKSECYHTDKHISQLKLGTDYVENSGIYLLESFPNPIQEELNLRIGLSKRMEITITIFDTHGRIVRNIRKEAMEGLNHFQLNDLGNLDAGTYIIKCHTVDGQSITQKFIKMD